MISQCEIFQTVSSHAHTIGFGPPCTLKYVSKTSMDIALRLFGTLRSQRVWSKELQVVEFTKPLECIKISNKTFKKHWVYMSEETLKIHWNIHWIHKNWIKIGWFFHVLSKPSPSPQLPDASLDLQSWTSRVTRGMSCWFSRRKWRNPRISRGVQMANQFPQALTRPSGIFMDF